MIEQKANSGVLWKNNFKGDNTNAPDYKGNINVDGKQFDIAAWVKDSVKDGTKFLSLSVSEPWNKDTAKPKAKAEQKKAVDEDTLPF